MLDPASLGLDASIDDPEPWAAPRCVVIVDDDLFVVDRSRLWVDSLHIQIIKSASNAIVLYPQAHGQLFVTNTVLQSDRESNGLVVEAYRCQGGMYAEGAPCVKPASDQV